MTTKPPAKIRPYPSTAIEKIVYDAVESIATREPNDRVRLAYSLLKWLENKDDSIENIIRHSRIRLEMPLGDAVDIIRKSLTSRGIILPS